MTSSKALDCRAKIGTKRAKKLLSQDGQKEKGKGKKKHDVKNNSEEYTRVAKTKLC